MSVHHRCEKKSRPDVPQKLLLLCDVFKPQATDLVNEKLDPRQAEQDNCNFQVLLEKQHDFSIHQRNLQVLMTEIYKI